MSPRVPLLPALALLALGALPVRAAASAGGSTAAGEHAPQLPERLSATGLFTDVARGVVADGVLTYTPQYPLWSDGARKRRWILLPPGTSIDASDPDAWVFPVGTRIWKEFAFERPVETRYMERLPSGGWAYATYLWAADGSDATLAPERGARGAYEIAPGLRHDVPGLADCRACHGAHPVEVLGFGALQLSPDRDPLAPHAENPPAGAVDLPGLVRAGLVTGLAPELLAHPPRVPAATPRERAVLGYLHGNCASCHNARGALADVGLSLEVLLRDARTGRTAPALATALDRPSTFRPPASDAALRLAPGAPERSVLVLRMSARDPVAQMPPFGTHLADAEALALVTAWVREDLAREAGPLAALVDR